MGCQHGKAQKKNIQINKEQSDQTQQNKIDIPVETLIDQQNQFYDFPVKEQNVYQFKDNNESDQKLSPRLHSTLKQENNTNKNFSSKGFNTLKLVQSTGRGKNYQENSSSNQLQIPLSQNEIQKLQQYEENKETQSPNNQGKIKKLMTQYADNKDPQISQKGIRGSDSRRVTEMIYRNPLGQYQIYRGPVQNQSIEDIPCKESFENEEVEEVEEVEDDNLNIQIDIVQSKISIDDKVIEFKKQKIKMMKENYEEGVLQKSIKIGDQVLNIHELEALQPKKIEKKTNVESGKDRQDSNQKKITFRKMIPENCKNKNVYFDKMGLITPGRQQEGQTPIFEFSEVILNPKKICQQNDSENNDKTTNQSSKEYKIENKTNIIRSFNFKQFSNYFESKEEKLNDQN